MALLANHLRTISSFLLVPLMMTSADGQNASVTYEYVSNAVVGGTVELPFCRFGRYELPPHLKGSERIDERYNRHSYSVTISNLEKRDSGLYKCTQLPSSPGEKNSNWMLQVYEPEELIDLSCEKEVYRVSPGESPTVTCHYKSIHPLTEKDVIAADDCRSNGEISVIEDADNTTINITVSDLFLATDYCVYELRVKSQPGITNVTRFLLSKKYLSPVTVYRKSIVRGVTWLEEVCLVRGNPRPNVTVTYAECPLNEPLCSKSPYPAINATVLKTERGTSYGMVEVSATFQAMDHFSSGIVTCTANNTESVETADAPICVYDPDVPFQIIVEQRLILPGEPTKITCQVPYCLYESEGKIRLGNDQHSLSHVNVTLHRAKYYYNITHEIEAMSAENEGTYTCIASKANDSCSVLPSAALKMFRQQEPTAEMMYKTVELGTPGTVYCKFRAYPPYELKIAFTKCDSEKIQMRDCTEAWEPQFSVNTTIDAESNHLVIIPAVETSGRYVCRVTNELGTIQKEKYVCIGDAGNDTQKLIIRAPKYVNENDQVNITCIASICQYRHVRIMFKPVDSQMVPVNEPMMRETDHFYRSVSTTIIANISNYNGGDFSCEGISMKSKEPPTTKSQRIMITPNVRASLAAESKDITGIIIGATLAVIAFVVLGAIGNILYQRRQHRNRNIRLANELKKGDIKSINPDLSLQEQAELLPLHSKWEFPRNQLKLGKQLGAGFFGVVLQGEAMGIIANEVKTIVAVKMAKKHSEGDVVRALVVELKIMSHMGRHPFVVRLLGAVIDGLGDNELMVVVEYCHFGNLNSYLLKNRRRFIDNWMNKHLGYANLAEEVTSDQSNAEGYLELTEEKDISAGCSSGQYVAYEVPRDGGPEENEKLLTNESEMQEMPLNTNILIGWSYQIARGMEWLASKRLMHGDLAARNVLLTTNNIVKICDFGLAKNMYAQQCYQRKEDAKLPVKWLALESVLDHIFTLKSDVWAYGVLLWEIFSLGMTPYPEFDNFSEILENLQCGYRMGRPGLAPECVFQLMLQCWKQNPDERPVFSELSNSLYQFLDEAHRAFLSEEEASGRHDEETDDDYLELFQPAGPMVNEYTEGYVSLPCPSGYKNMSSLDTKL